MTNEEFDSYLAIAIEELKEKQRCLELDFGFEAFERCHFDQERAVLEIFSASDEKVLEADVICIGSFATNSNSWMWAWSNKTLDLSLRRMALILKELGEITGFPLFSQPEVFEIPGESMAWDIAAICVRYLNALGVYIVPGSRRPLNTFLAITKIAKV